MQLSYLQVKFLSGTIRLRSPAAIATAARLLRTKFGFRFKDIVSGYFRHIKD
jgi:hypothetical protein